MKKYIFLFFLIIHSLLIAQEVDLYNQAVSCYNDKDFNCSKNEFQKLKYSTNYAIRANAHFYLAMSAANLYDSNTIFLFKNFIDSFPESDKYDDAISGFSSYLIKKRDYDLVIHYLSKENLDSFSYKNHYQALFNRAYANYMLGHFDLAAKDFSELLTQNESSVLYDAAFYYACLLLESDDLDGALNYFNIAQGSEDYIKKTPYYISYIMFFKKEYKSVNDYISKFIDDNTIYNYKELILFNAKANFQLKYYQESIVFFEQYKNMSEQFSEVQFYELGFSYYKLSNYEDAISNFNKIVDLDNDISQYAYYYLAHSYLAVNKKIEAANAFKSSFDRFKILESVFNDHSSEQVAENAFFNFALLCYELENSLYNPIDIFNEFINHYPDSDKLSEVYSYLSLLYLRTSDYDNAITVLEKNIQQEGVKERIQSVSYARGVQLFNDQKYEQAISCFQKSISYPISESLKMNAMFWKAEALFLQKKYEQSISALSDLLLLDLSQNLKMEALYTLGYSYEYLGQHDVSIDYFNRLLSQKTDSFNFDSLFFLEEPNAEIKVIQKKLQGFENIFDLIADNYFKLSEHDLAVKYYNLSYLFDFFQADYSLFKMGICFGIMNDYDSRLLAFNTLVEEYSDSEFFNDSMFELGVTYMLMNNYISSKNIFEEIISNYSSSVYFFDSKLKLAMSYQKLANNEMAIQQLKDVIQAPNASNLFKRDALNILESIYESLYQIDDFMTYIDSIPDYNFDKMALDSSMYYTAESEYISKNYLTAEKKFKHYLENFSNGLFCYDSKYYLSKSLIELGKYDEAIRELEWLLSQNNNQFSLNSIYLLADLYFQEGNFSFSEEKYNLLIRETSDIQYIKEANLRLLEINFELQKYQNVIDLALLIDSEDVFSNQEKIQLYHWLGMSYLSLDSWSDAIDVFQWIVDNSSGESQAKSLYYIAMVHFNSRDYDNSKVFIFQLANDLPSYAYWVSRGILLLAKIYLAEEDFFQATHVLEEFINKYDDMELVTEAKQLLNSINYE